MTTENKVSPLRRRGQKITRHLSEGYCDIIRERMAMVEIKADATFVGGVVVWVVGDATINGSETGTS